MKLCWEATGGAPESCVRGPLIAEDLIKEFEEEYGKIGRVKKRRNRKEDRKGELPGRYMVKMLYGWDDKRFNEEYWGWLKRN